MGKWNSRRWWVCLWAVVASSAIITVAIARGLVPAGLEAALPLLLGIIGGYIAADSMTKPKIKE